MRAEAFLLPLAALLALAPHPARSQTVELEAMTSPEVAASISAGKTTILVPTGGTEQNGPHMVLGKHNLIVKEAARRIALMLGNALVAPVLAYTPEGDPERRDGHMGFAGTLSLPPGVYARVLEAAASSLKAHGFETIVFLGDSGPNQDPQDAVAEDLTKRWAGDGVTVLNGRAYYDAAAGTAMLEAEGESRESIGEHAGIRDTSELLAVAPEGVRPDQLAAPAPGVSGDPRRASAERGQRLLELRIAAAVAEIRAPRASALLPNGGQKDREAPPSFLARLLRLVTG